MSDWTNIGQDDMGEVTGRALFVDDGTLGYYRHLKARETVKGALRDYASTYDSNRGDKIEVGWHLYEDGKEVDYGWYTFEVK
jgi:hypothetical protein